MSSLLFIILIGISMIIQGALYRRSIFKNVSISRSFDCTGVFPGEIVTYEFAIENRKLLPLTWVSINEKLNSGLQFEKSTKIMPINEDIYVHNIMLSLLPYQRIIRRYKLKAVKRGFYQLKYLDMTSTNLLGTEEYSVEQEVNAYLCVYPRLRDLKGAVVPANTTLGEFSVRRWIIEDPMVIAGVRAYSGSDSLKSINWKATAKNQQLLVNKYDFTADKKVMIILNLEKQEYALGREGIQTIEAAIEVCASVAAMLQEAGIPIGFATNAHTIGPQETNALSPNTGQNQLIAILEALAKVSYFKKHKARELLKLLVADFSWGTEVIVVTPEISTELIEDLQAISGIRNTLIALSEADLKVPSNIDLYYYKQEGERYEAI